MTNKRIDPRVDFACKLMLGTRVAVIEPDELAELLGEPPYREAIGVLKMISKSAEDLQFYEDRLKYLRDDQGKLQAARLEGLDVVHWKPASFPELAFSQRYHPEVPHQLVSTCSSRFANIGSCLVGHRSSTE